MGLRSSRGAEAAADAALLAIGLLSVLSEAVAAAWVTSFASVATGAPVLWQADSGAPAEGAPLVTTPELVCVTADPPAIALARTAAVRVLTLIAVVLRSRRTEFARFVEGAGLRASARRPRPMRSRGHFTVTVATM